MCDHAGLGRCGSGSIFHDGANLDAGLADKVADLLTGSIFADQASKKRRPAEGGNVGRGVGGTTRNEGSPLDFDHWHGCFG
jgi:hypothetical protein